MPDQNPIDAAISQAPPPNPIDLAIFNAGPTKPGQTAPANPIDAAIGEQQSQQQAPRATDALSQATSIGPREPTALDRVKAIFGSKAPQGSVMANATGQTGTQGMPQLVAPEAAMTPTEQFQHPYATGALKTIGGITTPPNLLMIAGTGGLAALPGAAGSIVPRLVSAGFAASIVKNIYDRVPDVQKQVASYNAAAARGNKDAMNTQESAIKETVAELGTSGVFAALAAGHAALGGKVAGKPGAAEAAPVQGVPPELAEKIPALQQSQGTLSPEEAIKAAGMSYKVELVAGSGVHQFESPSYPGMTAALRESEITPEAVANKMRSKIQEFQPITDAEAATSRAQAAGMPAEVTGRIQQNAEALKPIVDPEKIVARGDVQSQLDQAASALQRNSDPRMQEPLKFPEQQRLAQNLGMTPEQLLSTPSGQAFSAEQVVASNAMLEASRTNVMNMALLAATGDEAYSQQFLTALAKHQEIQGVVTGRVAAEAGRALGAFRNTPTEGTIAAAVDQLSKLPPDAQLTAAQQLGKIDPNDAGAVAKFVREIIPSSTADKLHEAWLNSLLSGGISVVKTVSDGTMRALGIATRPVAAAIDVARAAATGTPRERFAGDIAADIYGMFKGTSRAMGQFADTFVHEKSLTEDVMGSGGRGAAIKGSPGKIIRTPTRLLEAITDAAKIINYSSEIHTRAYQQAIKEGLSGKEAWSRATEIAATPTPELRQVAGDYALRQTFQQQLGSIGREAQAWKDINVMKVFGPKVGVKVSMQPGRWLIPFFRTPLNILKSAAEYSPAGAISSAIKAKWGNLEGGALSDALAKNTVGTALAATLAYHAFEGNVTGAGPTNANDHKRLESSGWQAYSVKVGNRYVSFRGAEPLGTVLSTAADLAETVRSNPTSLGNGGLVNQLKNRIDRNLESAPFIGGLMKLNQIWETPGKYVRGQAASVIPTGVANIAHTLDPTIREPSSANPFLQQVQQQIESRIPGLTPNVPAVTTPEGRPLQRSASAVGGFNPYPATTAQPGLGALEASLARKEQVQRAAQARKQLIKQRVAERKTAKQ